MYFIKVLISILLFFSSLVIPLVFGVRLMTIFYIGIFIPILLQKIWFKHWLLNKTYKQIWKNILFSFFFIIASIISIDSFIMMAIIIEHSDNDMLNIALLSFNRIIFFFAIIYLWNYELFKKKNMILAKIFKLTQITYTIVAVPIIILLLITLLTTPTFSMFNISI